jgi:hypothetical protein
MYLPFIKTVTDYEIVGKGIKVEDQNSYDIDSGALIGEPDCSVMYFDNHGILEKIQIFSSARKNLLCSQITVMYKISKGRIRIIGYQKEENGERREYPISYEKKGRRIFIIDNFNNEIYEVEFIGEYPVKIFLKQNGEVFRIFYYNKKTHMLEKIENYDTKTNMLYSVERYQSGKLVQILRGNTIDSDYTYSKDGFVHVIWQNNNAQQFVYKFDSQGNWIEKIAMLDGESAIVTRRKVSYADK